MMDALSIWLVGSGLTFAVLAVIAIAIIDSETHR